MARHYVASFLAPKSKETPTQGTAVYQETPGQAAATSWCTITTTGLPAIATRSSHEAQLQGAVSRELHDVMEETSGSVAMGCMGTEVREEAKSREEQKQDFQAKHSARVRWSAFRIGGFIGFIVYAAMRSSGNADSMLKDENTKLKEAMRFIIDKMAPTEEAKQELPAGVKELIKVDPRESLKIRQKELNNERKQLNKLEKTKEVLETKEKSFGEWKQNVPDGVIKEEKRHQQTMAELQEQIKKLERQRDGVEPIDVESDAEEAKAEQDGMKQELADLRMDMRNMMAYTSHLETQNVRLAEQMTQQLGSIMSCLQASPPMGTLGNWSPEQRVHGPGNTIGGLIDKGKVKDENARARQHDRWCDRQGPGEGRECKRQVQITCWRNQSDGLG